MIRRPPRSTRTDTLFPYTTLFRSVVAGQVLRLRQALVQHPVEPPGLVRVAVDGVGDLLLRETPEVVRLPQHRAESSHLPHQPLQRLEACPRRLRQQAAALFRKIDQDRAALEQRERRSEEHTSELQSLMRISYAVVCLKKKKKIN